jgi:hypothetical protein
MSVPSGVRTVTRSQRSRFHVPTSSHTDGERGYVAVVTALMITVLLLAAGLAVDLASWYARSTELQRFADVAALAGATAAPDLAQEVALANESLVKQGVQNGVGGMQVTVGQSPGFKNRLQVTVADTEIDGFFTSWLRKPPKIIRKSSAQYLQKISLGSAVNVLGSGDKTGLTNDGSTQDFWLAVSGYCTAKEDGDRLLSINDGNRRANPNVYWCQNQIPPGTPDAHENTDYNPSGYTYYVTVPCPQSLVNGTCPVTFSNEKLSIEAFDPQFDPKLSDLDTGKIDRVAGDPDPAQLPTITTTFEVYQPDIDPDLPDHLLTQNTFGPCASPCATTGDWVLLTPKISHPTVGRYRVQVYTGQESLSQGHNIFSLRAFRKGNFEPCTSISTVAASAGFDPECPSVAGDESMSVFANKQGGTAEMYLARLAPAAEYRGKRVRILLWDVGEGADTIEIISPVTGAPVSINHKTWDPGLKRLSDGTKILDKAEGWNPSAPLTGFSLDVGGYTQPVGAFGSPSVNYPEWSPTSRYGESKYNDRMVALEITVPKNYGQNAAVPIDGWWKIRYKTSTGIVQDRTTWSVTLAGDPVHLVN